MSEIIKDNLIPEMAPELQRGPDWLREKRREAKDVYNNRPLPPRGLHYWRYTDPTKFVIDKSEITDTAFGDNYDIVESLEKKNLEDGHLLGLITDKGGRAIDLYGFDDLKDKGVIACSLSDACENHAELVDKYLYQIVNSEMGKFEAMNGALWNDGIFVYIPDNVSIEKPIHLLRESGLDKSAQFPRALIIIGKNSELTIVDEYGGGSQDRNAGTSYTNSAVEIIGLEDSRTRYVMLQRQTSGAINYLTHRALLKQNATMMTIPMAFGGILTKQSFGVILDGKGADSKMYGMLFGIDRQHFDNYTLHHHAVGQTTSDIDFKVVLKDKSNSAYTGLIKIDQNAKTCEAYQENRNLMLNDGCKAETIPELEILNEDVMCSHGATIGPIDPEMVFYLTCRGIQYEDAVRMIVSGFFEGTLRLVPEDLRERITTFVAQRLEHL
jgi:Fe-S cluster assembly protein SufD